MHMSLLIPSSLLFCVLAAAQIDHNPPPVLRIYVEQVKPGKAAAHERAESGFVRAFAKANYPSHYIGLSSMAGPEEAWFVEEHSSFAEVEESEKASEAPALKAELETVSATDGEYLSGARSLIAVFRPDLSYRAAEAGAMVSKTRYVNVITFRIKLGSDQKFAALFKDATNIYNNVQMPQSMLTYQVISGAPGGTYLMFQPMTTLAEWDKYPAQMQALRTAGGRKFDALQRDFAEITVSEEGRLKAVNPRMSYVKKDIAAGDPDFWTPKPPPAAKPTSKPSRPAAKQSGAQ